MAKTLKVVEGVYDLTSPVAVGSYTHPATASPVMITVRLKIGDVTNPASGGTGYSIAKTIDGVYAAFSISSNTPGGVTEMYTPIDINGFGIVLGPGETMEVSVSGGGGDVAVYVETCFIDPFDFDLGLFLGDGSVPVNHDYGGVDTLQYNTEYGAPISDARVVVYTKADYDAGNRNTADIRGQTLTDANGRWRNTIMLEPDTYVLVFSKSPSIGPDILEIEVT